MYYKGGLMYFKGRTLSLFYGQFSILWVILSILWVATYFNVALYFNGATVDKSTAPGNCLLVE